LDSNPDAETTEYEKHQKSLEDVFNPIMAKVYQAAGGQPGGFPGGFPGTGPQQGGNFPGSGSTQGPKVDEVDWVHVYGYFISIF